VFAVLVAQGMARHLWAGLHDEYFWPMLAYLAAALLALGAMVYPGQFDARRWYWCMPLLVMTAIALTYAYWPRR